MSLKIKFQSDLDYQLNAINSVIDLFNGLSTKVRDWAHFDIVPNQDLISTTLLEKNLSSVQIKNNLPTTKLKFKSGGIYSKPNFSIEMETGSGKTYVYIRTIMELYQKFGFKKFIIVVPSVAIRQGVLANLRLTKQHFETLFDGISYNFRTFTSNKFSELSTYCRSNNLEIMIITLQSFNKKEINILYEKGRDDILLAETGIEMLAKTNPILILDEPHKMGSGLSGSALENLNPLFVLRYSATHTDLDKSHLLYSLGPVDAYRLGIVKKIDVIGTRVLNESSLPYIKLLDVVLKPKIKAKISLHVRTEKGVVEKSVLVEKGNSLHEKSKNPAYRDLIITNISGKKDDTYLELSRGNIIHLNETRGDIFLEVAKEQIENTIKAHFEKQEILKKHNVKVLSLFFIDEVTDYQEIDPSKLEGKKELEAIDPKKYLFVRNVFDKLFNEHKKSYSHWKNKEPNVVRGSYFSARSSFKTIEQDKEKIDEILNDKEKLLSFDSPTSFIFTHSALGEGWDNPNVFNICTLRLSNSEITKRQIIGRGLRIPVDQNGSRFIHNSENVLTIIANESYENFASSLQNDYEREGIMEKPSIENRRDSITAQLNRSIFTNKFSEIWNKLKIRTEFECNLITEKLIENCIKEIKQNLVIKKPMLDTRRASLSFKEDKIHTFETQSEPLKTTMIEYLIPDLVTRVSNDTGLTRKTISRIFLECDRLNDVFNNPEEFISTISTIIKEQRIKMEISTVTYQKTSNVYDENIFEESVRSYRKYVYQPQGENSVYNKVICDNNSEQMFAGDLSTDFQVDVFCKLPQNYYIGTPTGNYRPDWAIVYRRELIGSMQESKLHLVRETKFGYSQIRGTRKSIPPNEQDKITCAEKHFSAIGDIHYSVVTSYDDFRQSLPSNVSQDI